MSDTTGKVKRVIWKTGKGASMLTAIGISVFGYGYAIENYTPIAVIATLIVLFLLLSYMFGDSL